VEAATEAKEVSPRFLRPATSEASSWAGVDPLGAAWEPARRARHTASTARGARAMAASVFALCREVCGTSGLPALVSVDGCVTVWVSVTALVRGSLVSLLLCSGVEVCCGCVGAGCRNQTDGAGLGWAGGAGHRRRSLGALFSRRGEGGEGERSSPSIRRGARAEGRAELR